MLSKVGALLLIIIIVLILFAISKIDSPQVMSSVDTSSKQSLRLVIVSDTHGIYRHPIPHGDVLIHCGDSEWSAAQLEQWAEKYNHTHVLAVSGNMDYRLGQQKDTLKRVTYLQDSELIVSGIKIYGSPWTPRFVGVFQLDDQNEAEKVWERVPLDVDVLITHGPPKGIRDITSRGRGVGDGQLLTKVLQINPRVHCFGHIHESYGTHQSDKTLFCNAAVFNGHAPIVVDVPLDKTKPAVVI